MGPMNWGEKSDFYFGFRSNPGFWRFWLNLFTGLYYYLCCSYFTWWPAEREPACTRYHIFFFSQSVFICSISFHILEFSPLTKPVQQITRVQYCMISLFHFQVLQVDLWTCSFVLLPPCLVYSKPDNDPYSHSHPILNHLTNPPLPVVTSWPARGSLLLLVWSLARLYAQQRSLNRTLLFFCVNRGFLEADIAPLTQESLPNWRGGMFVKMVLALTPVSLVTLKPMTLTCSWITCTLDIQISVQTPASFVWAVGFQHPSLRGWPCIMPGFTPAHWTRLCS